MRIRRAHKKGALDLSVNSIIVFVLAFAMLAVGIFFTNYIRNRMIEGTEGMVDITKLDNPPDSINPITLPSDEISVKRKADKRLTIGFYNKGSSTAELTTLSISACIDNKNNPIAAESLPTLSAAASPVPPSEGSGFKVLLTEQGMMMGGQTYICTIVAHKQGTDPTVTENIIESKQFFLTVTT
jgi:hypothetical protein